MTSSNDQQVDAAVALLDAAQASERDLRDETTDELVGQLLAGTEHVERELLLRGAMAVVHTLALGLSRESGRPFDEVADDVRRVFVRTA